MIINYFIWLMYDVKNYADLGVNILLNPSTTDGCREGAWWNWRELQASAEGNNDNPVSSNHRAPSHWEPQWRNTQILTRTHPKGRESWGQKQLKLLHRTATWAKWLTSKSAVKLLKPKTAHIRWRPLARIVLCLTSPEWHLATHNICLDLHNSSRWM